MDTQITSDMLETRIAAARDSATLDESQKARLIDLYRQSLSNLESFRANKEATEELRQAGRSAPAEMEKVQATQERWAAEGPITDAQISAKATSSSLAGRLDEELANKTAVDAKLAVLEARLESEAQRPGFARKQITSARTEVQDLASQAGDLSNRNQSPEIAEAAGWARATRLEALQARITALDRELLTYGARNDLLRAQRDEQATNSKRIGQKIDLLRTAVNERRREEAGEAMREAEKALEGASDNDPVVRELAQENLDLVGMLAAQVAKLDELIEIETNRPSSAEVDSAFRSARRKLELDSQGSGAAVGLAILDQRRQLPSARSFMVQRRAISRSLSAVSLRLLESEEEKQQLQDPEGYLLDRVAAVGQEELAGAQLKAAQGLLKTRITLLARTVANDNALQR